MRVAIIGGGIGGLTLGLALRQYDIDFEIYEAAAELREVGAAVGLAANSTRFYEGRLGLGDVCHEKWAEVDALIFRDGRSGEVVGRHSAEGYAERHGGPWVGIHRADLQAILSTAVGPEQIKLNKRLVSIDDSGNEAVLAFTDGTQATADLVIGADGARSTVRRLLLGYDDALYSGCSAFRGIVAPDQLDLLPDPGAIQFWMGPGGHMLHYPLDRRGSHNFFLVERNPSPWQERQWVIDSDGTEHLDHFSGWHPAVVQMISAVPVTQRWALFHRPPLSQWSRGRVTLLGDAAHALVPHHGQGANQSIEDAIVLADQLHKHSDTDLARAEYERLRRGRTRKVQYASITTGDVLHLPDGPRADERNARLGAPGAAEHHLGWIHGFAADTDEPDERSGGTWL